MQAHALSRDLSQEVLPPGTRLGRYELIKRVAIGGMAELYLARATGIEGFEKLVALKRMRPEHADNPELVTMFLDEARLTAMLQHANVAQVYDIGQTEHGLFFTMEFVYGEDVRRLLKDRVGADELVPLSHVVTIVSGIAAGLHAAHEKTGNDGACLGVVHRDVSPANILVSYDGCVKLIDFGVAKAARQQSETQVGMLKGKIAYMSPEQCLGDPVDRRTDVFALGIVLYELTTGAALFTGKNEFAIMKRIVGQDVAPPSSLRAGYPMRLEEIVLKALARNPEQRYATTQALQLDLERFARDSGYCISTVALGAYMREVFRDRQEAWEQILHNLGDDDDAEIEVCVEPMEPPVGIETWMFRCQDGDSDGVPEAASEALSGALSGPAPKAMVAQSTRHPAYRERPAWILPVVGLGALGGLAILLMLVLSSADRATEASAGRSDDRPATRSSGALLAPLETPAQLGTPAAAFARAAPSAEPSAVVTSAAARSMPSSTSASALPSRKPAKRPERRAARTSRLQPTVTVSPARSRRAKATSVSTSVSKSVSKPATKSGSKPAWNSDSALPPM